MGWKTINGRSYYYRNSRENGRVVTKYWGSGESASLIAEMDRYEGNDRQAEAIEERERRSECRQLDSELDGLVRAGKLGAAEFLEAEGFHRHKGQWRKQRRKGGIMTDNANPLRQATNPSDGGPTLLEAATPQRETYGLDSWAIHNIAAKLTGKDRGDKTFELVFVDILDHAAELAGPNPRPIERTLAESAAMAWAALRYSEGAEMVSGDRSLHQAAHSLSRIDHAHRRYVSALKTLAQVRRLSGPSVQVVNIGGQNQTNVIGSPSPEFESD